MLRAARVSLLSLAVAAMCASPVRAQTHGTTSARTDEWSAYGHDALGSRYSPLADITPANVSKLAVAWTFSTGEAKVEVDREVKFEATPLMVDGTLYLSTPMGKVFALDPESGRTLWSYDAHADITAGWGDFANRGVSTWVDPRAASGARCKRRIIAATIDARLIALDSRTGALCTGFGEGGIVNLRRGLHNAPYETSEYELTSPPAVINGLLVTGSAVADNGRTAAASGEVRAYDARSGALRWTWDPVPRDSTDAAWSSWRGPLAHSTGAANAWSVIAADSARDLVFVPTGSASPDYYGGERIGDNRYANSVVALRASTGKVAWHFQAVHHDLWDYDVASPPLLATITHEGKRVDVVMQAVKTGQLYILDRATGRPVFPVEERAVPVSHIAGEHASPTQPFNSVLPALSPQRFDTTQAWGPSAASREACLAQFRTMRNEGPFTPPSLEGTLQVPSNVGGAHWGGVAYDPTRQIVVAPVNTIAAFVQLIPVDRADTAEMRANRSRLGDQYTRMHGTPYVMRRRIITGPEHMPCTAFPWGSLVALDLSTGTRAWSVPLGDPALMRPGAPSDSTMRGLPNLGGPIITASGLVFIGASMDRSLRAFDVQTGKELWRGALPAGARATPMTYRGKSGRQFVVIAAGGGDEWGKGDALVAFALPAGASR